MKQDRKRVLPMWRDAEGPAAQTAESAGAWTLVDYLFPAERGPVWCGSARAESEIVLAKTA
ncbi:MAG TPA: hypothetical protein VHE33_15980 [Acidobacteriaceae bacterium]|nr:hypothetical protein [Acidobacteriaceae bacterium]